MNTKNQTGITLIEIVITTAIFAMILGLLAGIFVNVRNTNDRLLARQKVYQNLDRTMEYLSGVIRESQIDYSVMGNNLNLPENELILVDRDGRQIRITLNNNIIQVEKNGQFYNLTNSDFQVTNLEFYVSPQTIDSAVDRYQNLITVVITAKAANVAALINLQTTLSSRVYAAQN